MSSKPTDEARARAEEKFKKEQVRATEANDAKAEYDARQAAMEVNTARLKALRIEKEAAERDKAAAAANPGSSPKSGAR